MKKFIKFTLSVISLAAIAGGIFYFVRKILMRDSWDDMEDEFDDDFEDELSEELDVDQTDLNPKNDVREYVTLNVSGEEETEASDGDDPVTEHDPLM